MSLVRAEGKSDRKMLLRLLKERRLDEGKVVVLNPILEEAVGNLNCHGIVLNRNGFDWFYPGLKALGVQFVFDGLQNVLPELIHESRPGDKRVSEFSQRGAKLGDSSLVSYEGFPSFQHVC